MKFLVFFALLLFVTKALSKEEYRNDATREARGATYDVSGTWESDDADDLEQVDEVVRAEGQSEIPIEGCSKHEEDNFKTNCRNANNSLQDELGFDQTYAESPDNYDIWAGGPTYRCERTYCSWFAEYCCDNDRYVGGCWGFWGNCGS